MLCDECPWRFDYDGQHLLANMPEAPQLDDPPARGDRWCSMLEDEIPASGICMADVMSLKVAVNEQVKVLKLYTDQITKAVRPLMQGTLGKVNMTLSAIQATKRLLAALRLLHYRQREGPKG